MEAAAITIIFNEKDEVLLLKRTHPDGAFLGYWGFPGGETDASETNEQAAIRETKEETNLDVQNLKFLRVSDGYVHAYTTRDFRGDLQLGIEHDCHVWKSINELDDYKLIPGSMELIKEATTL